MTITPDPKNANKGTQRGRGLLEKSLREYGAGRSVLADRNGVLIAGNKTHEVATEIGLPVRVIETDGNELVVVQRTDLDLSRDKAAIELGIADNRVGQVSLEWDIEVLTDLAAEEIDLSKFWSEDEIAALLGTPKPIADDPGAQVDRADELRQKWQTERGQLWQIGRHRLLCGDSTSADDVARLMAGERAALLATDPPYNVNIDYGDNVDDAKALEEYQSFTGAWFAEWCAVSDRQIVTPGYSNLASWLRWFDPFYVAPWTKTNSMTRGKVAQFWCWEPIIYFGDGWKRKRPNDVFTFNVSAQSGGDMGSLTPFHPCPKPVTLWVDFLENYTEPDDLVADAFDGSATTLVACEQTGRRGVGMELEPKYVAVALERLTGLGLEARRLG